MDGFVVPPVSTGIHSSHTTAILASAVRPRPLISVKQLLLQLLFPAGNLGGKYQANQHNRASAAARLCSFKNCSNRAA